MAQPGKPELVVVDANILISLLIAKGTKHQLFFSEHITPVSPELILFEIGKYWKEIVEGSGLSEPALKQEFAAVRERLNTLALEDTQDMLKEAKHASPDKDDAEYFAAALKLNCPIWSEDKLLKKQSRVEVLNTPEILERLGLK
jgi:predicted nucleic acid-binding protein